MFSIIIPLYNKEKDILTTIDSVLNQSFNIFEVIVVDDSSTDDSLRIVNEINDPRVKVFSKENQGVSCARNYGVQKASFDYFAFLDGDDLWDENYLAEIYNTILEFGNYLVFATNYRIQFSDFRYYEPTFVSNVDNDFIIVKDYFYYSKINSILTSSSIIIHKEVVEKIGLFDINLTHGEDLDYWFRITKYFDFIFINKYLMTYRHNSSNRSVSIVPNLSKTVISKYNLSGITNFDAVLSKIASRFAINYLLNNNNKDALYCFKKIKKFSFLYYSTLILFIIPYFFRKFIFDVYMNYKGSNILKILIVMLFI